MGQLLHTRIAPYGVVRDLSPQLSDGAAWSEARGVAFRNLRTEPGEAYQHRDPAPRFEPGRLHYRELSGAYHWFYSGWDGIGLNVGTADYDVTPVGWSDDTPGRASWCSLNSIPVHSTPTKDPVYHGGDPNTAMVALPNWPSGWRCGVMRSYKFYLLAMNVTDSGSTYENQVRWSAAADPGNVPNEWLPSATNDARSLTFGDQSGAILDGMTLGDEFMVYKGSSTHAMRYIGGVWVMRQRTLFRELGILTKDCCAEWQGKHFLVAEGDVVMHDGVAARSIADKAVRRAIFDDIDATRYAWRAFAYDDPLTNEFVFYYPASGATKFCNRRAAYNHSDQRWTIEEVQPQEISHAAVGRYDRSIIGYTWAEPAGISWRDDAGRWNEGADRSTGDQTLLALGTARQFGEQVSSGGRAGAPIRSNLKLLDQALGRADVSKMIDRVSIEGGAETEIEVGVRVGSADNPAAPVIWQPPQTLRLGPGRELPSVQPLAKGRYMSLELDLETTAKWHIDAIHVQYREQGRWS